MSRNYVVKSNNLIEARYRLSLQESHVILWLLNRIQPDDEDFKEHKLEIDEFSKMIGVKPDNQYRELREVTKRLIQRAMEIYEPEINEHIQMAWLCSARYQHKKGCVLLKFSPELKPYLLQLKSQFTKISITDMLKLKSIYAIRIFELLLQYASIGKREISIEYLRNYCGITKKEYPKYSNLKIKVIDRAKYEINSKTDIVVDYEEIKTSRKVTSIGFTIKKNPNCKQTEFEKSQQEKTTILQKEYRSDLALIERLVEYGFTKQKSKILLEQETQENISNALKAVDLQVSRGNVKNPKTMLLTAIQEKWHPEKYRDRNIKNTA